MTMQAEYHGDFCCTVRDSVTGAEIRTRPESAGGDRAGRVSPTDLVGAALATCAMTVLGYAASHRKVDVTGARVDVDVRMTPDGHGIAGVDLVFHMPPGDYPGKVRKQLERAANVCPVHAALGPQIEQNISFVWPDRPAD